MHAYEVFDNQDGSLKTRCKYALNYFDEWWEAGEIGSGTGTNIYNGSSYIGNAEPNAFASLCGCSSISGEGYNDYFFRIEQGYVQGIMLGIERTKDELSDAEKMQKIYEYDAKMKSATKVSKLDNSAIAQAACLIAWPSIEQSKDNDGTPCYQRIHDLIFNTTGESNTSGSGDSVYMSCDRTACTAIRWSGVDDNFPGGNTLVQEEYLNSSPRWTELDWGGDINNLQPGDVLIRKDTLMPGANFEPDGVAHHIFIYCGNNICKALADEWGYLESDLSDDVCIVHGSYNERSPGMGTLSDNYKSYHAYRCTDPMVSGKSIYASYNYTTPSVSEASTENP